MGVNSLWTIIGPAARPVRLEALARKKLAVDASIWIYQFLKAVRDEEGNAISNSHIVGFFRRICKLLYYGILPVFVFDGGAPVLKRRVLRERQERRKQGERDGATQKAQKLLARQLQRYAENGVNDKEVTPIQDTDNKSNKLFRRKDEFHLPTIESFRVSTKDGRIMKEDELNEAYEDFDHVDGIDINSVDPESKEFSELPKSTQYMILSHLRIRSRLRMGYDKDQLDGLFPNRMEFSKFQIEQVQKRNFYTQRLMDVSGMGDSGNADRRIAGDKDRRYALVKNEDGWTLSLGGDESSLQDPILLDDSGNVIEVSGKPSSQLVTASSDVKVSNRDIHESVEKPKGDHNEDEDEEEDVDWEDVSIEEETEEEKQIQRAIIESIYSKYQQDETSKLLGNIAPSNQTKKVTKNTTSLNDNGKLISGSKSKLNLPDLNIDLSNSFLFNKNSDFQKNTSAVPESGQKEHIPINLQNDYLEDDLKDQERVSLDADKNNNDVIKQKSDEKNNDDIKEKSGSKSPKVQNTLPEWFSEHISLQQNPYNESNDREIMQTKEDINDEKAGLIPWNEAQPYLAENNDSSSDNEIQELSWKEIKDHPTNDVSKEINKDVVEVQSDYNIDHDKESSTREERKPVIIDYDFEEEEETNLVQQLVNEELDHEEFKSEMRSNLENFESFSGTKVTDDQLLNEKLKKSKRDSDEVTENMILDIQELLKRFGIPYITAPMEAEAQCAELLKLKLVDGIITDDSDCFLFGGDRVYKNMFQQKNFVECYIKDDIEEKLGLNQNRLIELALLLGSDYTEGIKGIGPVLSMEILAEFGTLESFKIWFDENTKTTKALEKTDITPLKRNLLTKVKKGKLFLPDSFPDNIIFEAYNAPEVDHDTSEFKWGFPNLDQIRSFLMYNVNWDQQKVDDIMIPLIRDMNKKRSESVQPRINEFFPLSYIASQKDHSIGKRLKTASNKLNKKKRV